MTTRAGRRRRIAEVIAEAVLVLLIAGTAYLMLALGRFAIVHPNLTDTQRLMHLIDALLWRTLP